MLSFSVVSQSPETEAAARAGVAAARLKMAAAGIIRNMGILSWLTLV
jgi:hypothetical protein